MTGKDSFPDKDRPPFRSDCANGANLDSLISDLYAAGLIDVARRIEYAWAHLRLTTLSAYRYLDSVQREKAAKPESE